MNWLKRFLRHVWMSPIMVKRQFPATTISAIGRAVTESEKSHRGQVRFVIEAELTTSQLWAGISARQRAIDVFYLTHEGEKLMPDLERKLEHDLTQTLSQA